MKKLLLVVAIAAGAAIAPIAVSAAPGDPAPGFGTNGVVSGGLLDTYGPLAVDDEGRIVVLGRKASSIAIARFAADGKPDTSFSGDGRAELAITNHTAGLVDVRVLDDGSIVAIGRYQQTSDPFTNGLWSAKLTAAGAPAPGYGTSGVSLEAQGFVAHTEVGAIAPDGSAVIHQQALGGGISTRIGATGAFDTGDTMGGAPEPPSGCSSMGMGSPSVEATAFTDTGVVIVVSIATYDCGGSVASYLVVTGRTSATSAVAWAKLYPKQSEDWSTSAAAVGSDVLLASGSKAAPQQIRRFAADGTLVSTWGSSGTASAPAGFGYVGDMAELSSGRVVLVNGGHDPLSADPQPSTLLIEVLLPSGADDPEFDRVSVPLGGPFGGAGGSVHAAATGDDILVTTTRESGQSALRRFTGPAPVGPPISGGGPVEPGAQLCFDVAGKPGDVALVNLTPVLASGPGDGQLISSGLTPPEASNVNFGPGSVDPNVAAAPIGADGKVCYVNSKHSNVQVVADHLGSVSRDAITLATPTGAPDRKVDTRSGTGAGPVGRGQLLCFAVAGTPGDVALVNLTPVLASGPGDGQLISSGLTPPEASNVNFAPGSVDPNVAIAPIGGDGKVCFANSTHSSVHLVADHLGTIAKSAFTLASPSGAPLRRVDTRPAP